MGTQSERKQDQAKRYVDADGNTVDANAPDFQERLNRGELREQPAEGDTPR